jgi:hypothetical protein
MIELNCRFLFPDNEVCKLIMGIPSSFNINKPLTKEMGAEIIGQAVDVTMHKRLTQCIESHIEAFLASTSQRSRKSFECVTDAINGKYLKGVKDCLGQNLFNENGLFVL